MGGLTFKFRPSMDMQQTLEMISNDFLRLRAEAIQRKITYDAATLMQEEVQNRIPRTAQYAAYRSALKIVQSGFASAPVFAIMADPAEAQSETVEGETDVLTFKLRGSKRRRSPGAEILVQYQPWTLSTLPFVPDPKDATMVKRKVSKREVEAVAKAREDDRQKWLAALQSAGIRPDPPQSRIGKEVKATPDMTYLALRLEFGLGGSRAVAHWRPALGVVKERISKRFQADSGGEFSDAMLNWRDTQWRKWSKLSAPNETLQRISRLQGFQRKISG